jgi:metal-dependent hydrolase (beta-lactamase superfamily II)
MTIRGVTPFSKTRSRTTAGLSRRRLLKWGSASVLSVLDIGMLLPTRRAQALEPEAPILDGLSLTVVTDDVTSETARRRRLPDLIIEESGVRAIGDESRSGLIPDRCFSLHVRSFCGAEMRNILFDFGAVSDTLSNNMARLRINPSALDQVVSPNREQDRRRLPVVAGRWNDVAPVGGHGLSATACRAMAATDDVSARTNISSSNEVRPPTSEECARELSAITVSFLLVCRGLIVVTSCHPRDLGAAVQQARSASGVETVHAVVMGTNLADAGGQRAIQEAIAALEKIGPDHVMLGHCSGNLLYEAAMSAMPNRVIRTAAGMRISFVL